VLLRGEQQFNIAYFIIEYFSFFLKSNRPPQADFGADYSGSRFFWEFVVLIAIHVVSHVKVFFGSRS